MGKTIAVSRGNITKGSVKDSKKSAPKVVKVQSKPIAKKTEAKKTPVKKAQISAQKVVKVKKAAVPKKVGVIKVAKGPAGYTVDESSKFNAFKALFSKKNNQQLKDILKKNLQSMTGNKDDLVYKCADGATLGRIPRCPNCFGGRYSIYDIDPNLTTKKEPTSVQATETTLISTIATLHSTRLISSVIPGKIDGD